MIPVQKMPARVTDTGRNSPHTEIEDEDETSLSSCPDLGVGNTEEKNINKRGLIYEDMEIWATVPNSSGYYVSSKGRVINRYGRLSQAKPRGHGYLDMNVVFDDGVKKLVYLHRLVAISFLGIQEDKKMVVDHIDQNRANNCLDNLRWVTVRENSLNKCKFVSKKY
jgi:hypothetical protein